MNKSEIKKALLDNYKRTLNKKSKWYNDDVCNFSNGLDRTTDHRLIEMYDNMVAFSSRSFEKLVKDEEQKMLKAGMYNIGNMRPDNCMD